MGERKVINRYYPPDFDPSNLPKAKKVRSEDKQMKVRMMLPMSVRCNSCGTYLYKGTKFNTRMEDVRGERYLGIKIFRFYYRCSHCSAEFCMRTDPEKGDYVVEAGATRNFEPHKDRDKSLAAAIAAKEDEERGSVLAALDNRALEARREMEALDALEEVKQLNDAHGRVGLDQALAAIRNSGLEGGGGRAAEHGVPPDILDALDEEDEEAVRAAFRMQGGLARLPSSSEDDERGAGPADNGGGGRVDTAIATASPRPGPSLALPRRLTPSLTSSRFAAAEELEAEEADDGGAEPTSPRGGAQPTPPQGIAPNSLAGPHGPPQGARGAPAALGRGPLPPFTGGEPLAPPAAGPAPSASVPAPSAAPKPASGFGQSRFARPRPAAAAPAPRTAPAPASASETRPASLCAEGGLGGLGGYGSSSESG